jgi:hypothetical protein
MEIKTSHNIRYKKYPRFLEPPKLADKYKNCSKNCKHFKRKPEEKPLPPPPKKIIQPAAIITKKRDQKRRNLLALLLKKIAALLRSFERIIPLALAVVLFALFLFLFVLGFCE